MKKLTPKQQAFVDAYTGPARGNATEAARMAGYRGNDKTLSVVGAENLAKPSIQSAVKSAAEEVQENAIATRVERQQVLTEILRHGEKDSDRVKATEVLGRMQGDLLDVDIIRERLRELKARMPPDAYRELLIALQE